MILENCMGSITDISVNYLVIILTAVLALLYFGSRKILKKGISPIGLIGISALIGIVVYAGV